VTKQITLTSHLVDVLFIGVSNKLWGSLGAVQKSKLKASAQAAASYNNDNRMADEKQLVDYFKSQGLSVTTPDLDAFRKSVQASYLQSDYAKLWPKGLLERINATGR
jgi:TRAP-type C4-dicarboxylate transport system substrate-binding protein